MIYEDGVVDFVIFVHEEKVMNLSAQIDSLLKSCTQEEKKALDAFHRIFRVIFRTTAWIMKHNQDIRNFTELILSNTFYRGKDKILKQ